MEKCKKNGTYPLRIQSEVLSFSSFEKQSVGKLTESEKVDYINEELNKYFNERSSYYETQTFK